MTLFLFSLSMVLFYLSGFCNGLMDLISFHWNDAPEFMKKNPEFWNPKESWKNKYVEGSPLKKLLYSTVFVGFTDGWHRLKTMMKFSSFAGSSVFAFTLIGIDLTLIKFLIGFALSFVTFYIAFQLGFKASYK